MLYDIYINVMRFEGSYYRNGIIDDVHFKVMLISLANICHVHCWLISVAWALGGLWGDWRHGFGGNLFLITDLQRL